MSIPERVAEYMEQARPYIENWGLLAVGAGILGETLLFAGVFIPGFSILVTAGLMSAQGILNPWATLAVALAGGIIGDQTAYILGRFMGDRLLARHARALAKLRYALTHEGGLILLWYHYVSPMRIVMPYIAGSLRYPRLRWFVLDTIGLTLWVFFAFGLGYFAMGPLKRFGDLGYYVIFAAVLGMVIFTVWRIVGLLLRRETPADMFAEEAELAAKVAGKAEAIEEKIEQSRAAQPPR